jgi:ABC-2 type transport system permease protein
MRKLWALVRTEFLREFSSPVTLIFFLVLPLVFTAAVSAGLSGMGGDEAPEEVTIPIYVVNEDQGTLSDALLDTLGTTNLAPEAAESLPANAFALQIPADFSAQILEGEPVTLTLQTRGDRGSPAVEQAVQAAQSRLSGAIDVARIGLEQARAIEDFESPEAEAALFRSLLEDALAAAEDPPAVPQVVWAGGAELEDPSLAMATNTEQASAGQIVTWVQITLLGAAEVLVDERMRGTLRRLLVVPATRAGILAGKLVSRLLLGLTQIAILLVGGALLFGVDWGRDPIAVAAVSLAFALATVSLGLLVATFVRTRGQASSVVVGLSMALAAMGGAWFPLEVTPPLYRQLVKALPSTWAMQAYTDLLARGSNLGDVLLEVGVLVGFAVVFIVLGLLRFREYE